MNRSTTGRMLRGPFLFRRRRDLRSTTSRELLGEGEWDEGVVGAFEECVGVV